MGSRWTCCNRIHRDDPFHWGLVVQVTHSTSRLSAYKINSKLRNLALQDPRSLVSLHHLRGFFLYFFSCQLKWIKMTITIACHLSILNFDTLYHHPASTTNVSIASLAFMCHLESHFSKERPCASHKQKSSLCFPFIAHITFTGTWMWNEQGGWK